jgi:TM2 domain-containing membrane protein YozV
LEFRLKKAAVIAMFIVSANCFAIDKSILSQIPQEKEETIYNPLHTASLSLMIPGGGQVYTGNYTKGFLFLATEGILGWITFNNRRAYHRSYQQIYEYTDSLRLLKRSGDFSPIDTMHLANRIALAEHNNLLRKARYYNSAAFLGAVGIWNVLDGIGVSNAVKGAQNPNPRKAMALSAIPFTGAGQFYNGEWFKAGLVMTTQTAFTFGGIQFQHLMNKSTRYVRDLGRDSNFVDLPRVERIDRWRDNYNSASRRRTMFFWYGIIFYIYGMTDAYVDASLSNFERKFDITADYLPQKDEITLGFVLRF